MSNFRSNRKYIITSLLLVTAIVGITISNQFRLKIQQRHSLDIPPGPELIYFHFGYSESLADSAWMRAIQNFSNCEQDRGGSPYTPSGTRMGLDRTPSCSRGWLYRMLSLILDLAPRFHTVAQTGPTVLSTIVDDIDGASELYLKVVKLYPNDWVILSRAAGHFALETEDRSLAAQLYVRAVKNGAPTWMALYASKLWEKDGQKELGEKILLQFRENSRLSEQDREYIEKKLGLRK